MGVARSSVGHQPAWVLETSASSMLLTLGSDDTLFMPHWGGRGGRDAGAFMPQVLSNRPSETSFHDGQPLAYPTHGAATFKEPCLVLATADGARGARFKFEAERLDGDVLELDFMDELLGARLGLRFEVFSQLGLVARRATITNVGSQVLTLERAFSAAFALPPDEYDLCSLHGQWSREFELSQRPLLPGRVAWGSTRGLSSHEAHPWFAIRPRGEQAEHGGRVWFGSLAWSGNWQCVAEVERNDSLNVVIGLQPFDFAWRLEPGEHLETPEVVAGYTEDGLAGAARLLHTYEETVQLPAAFRERPRPVLYNSWEATHFDVQARAQVELATMAAGLGIELFVIDDGWFGERHNDTAGLGDWTVNATKFPNGLRELVDHVHGLGMQFGIWVEPEMVNPDSDLYRAHPDWAYHAERRTPTLGRNQMVLNFARQDVREAMFQQLHDLLSQHGPIEFMKWDHNRAWTEVGWPENPPRQREAWVRHVHGLYEVWARLRQAFPNLMIESCAGGGGRADLGVLRWTDQVWTSDNTDAADRLTIQYGYSRAHTARVMVNWVTDVPNQQTGRLAPLDFRFHVAMAGVLGVGGDIRDWSADDLQQARQCIEQYKAIRPIVQFGRQYWLRPPAPIGACGVQFVSPQQDSTVVFLYQVRGLRGRGARRMRLLGLDPERTYTRHSDGATSSGAALMSAGLPATLVSSGERYPRLDFRSEVQVWRGIGGDEG